MDFDDTADEAAFRQQAYAWLADHASLKSGITEASAMTDAFSDAEVAHVKASKEWQSILFENGWAGITWPIEAGGCGGSSVQQMIFNQEQSKFDVPQSIFAQGIGMAGPTLIRHGTAEQKARFLPPMLRGDELWCQLFSEPGAGSDLAALSTRAEPDGDEFVVNGQKVWTSSAHYSDWGILLTRTNFDVPKHQVPHRPPHPGSEHRRRRQPWVGRDDDHADCRTHVDRHWRQQPGRRPDRSR